MRRFGIIQWILAIGIAVFILNIFSFIYYHQAGWIDRYDSSTYAIWNPNSFITNFYEGYGVAKVDENGYFNTPNKKLVDKNYILLMGSSHTQGEQLLINQKFSYILNDYITDDDSDELKVYNIAQDGNFYPDIIRCFSSAVQEFPESKCIIIEVGSTSFSINQLNNCLNQDGYNVKYTGKNILNNISYMTKMKIKIKEVLPLINLYRQKQFANMKIDFSGAFLYKNSVEQERKEEIKNDDYKAALNRTMSLISSEYNGQIIILYHPTVSILKNGTLKIDRDDTSSLFESCCIKNDIIYCDTGDAFLEAYRKDYTVPYGFSNTSPATGHLNKYGHKIIADELLKIIVKNNLYSIGGDK